MAKALTLGVLLLVSPALAGAQPIVNPDFDDNLDGWNIHFGATSWSPDHDYQDSSESGSMVMVKNWPVGPLVNNLQCVPVTEGMVVGIATEVLVPVTSPLAHIYLTLSYFTDESCLSYDSFDRSSEIPPQGAWVTVHTEAFTVPSGMHSAAVQLQMAEVDTIPATAYFDHVQLFIFRDGFESGNTTEWSSSSR
jgi:hypothetical protein